MQTTGLTSAEMLKTKLPKDHIWHNRARLGSKPIWEIIPAPSGWWFKNPSGDWYRTA